MRNCIQTIWVIYLNILFIKMILSMEMILKIENAFALIYLLQSCSSLPSWKQEKTGKSEFVNHFQFLGYLHCNQQLHHSDSVVAYNMSY